ncbi:LysE family translocator [Bacillus sp. WLY-B-L8]|uniref:LysE family translocator n=1 Tax=Bacillus multifaciens TaxID=3068506 RepID=UPI0027419367|nr:LysE family translocator [Bacillus sp. WLY-B-L8]MDP7980552.1 LysE family translocator [Bacillus sp. WLY-B-L8]HDX9587526.1 LysE family translocator [Bacillus pseudomycoides]
MLVTQYYLFVTMSIFLIILPGPDTGLVTQNTMLHGKQGGMKTVFGILSGLSIHTLAAVLGISAILVKSAFLFSIFKYIGAIYLIYLGCVSLWSLRKTGKQTEDSTVKNKYQGASCFRQGFLTNLLNPKVAIFFLTFLPQFIQHDGNTFFQLFIMGMTYTVLTFLWFILYIYLINAIRTWMKKPSTERAIQGISGFVLLAFGIKLALEKRP